MKNDGIILQKQLKYLLYTIPQKYEAYKGSIVYCYQILERIKGHTHSIGSNPEAGYERIHSCVHTKALGSSPLPDLSAVPEDSPSVLALTGPLLHWKTAWDLHYES